MTKLLLTNWHWMRWLRLGIGLYLVFETVRTPNWPLGLLAAFFVVQALTNTGCGTRACSLPKTGNKNRPEPVDHEAIKP
ncbi:hypothetical protein ACO2Q8_17250 [Larkinella sp. VNQ87]|uniref:hypothetical protein n=1 Tax=Larkinella sp. VNQ87 TaxID=3400921 RepID=UPI003C1035F0